MTTSALRRSTARAQARTRLTALRAAFGVLDRVAPDLAARWALDIWCTLPKNGGRRRDERPAGGVRADVVGANGNRLAVETWGAGPPVYLAHGWGGWRGQLGAFVVPIVAAGFRVVAFDAPSHGDSTPGALGPGRGSAAEFAQALGEVIGAYGPAAGVVAHSLGGATSALAIHDGASVGRLAMIAPSPDPVGMTDALAATLGYSSRTKRAFLAKLQQRARRPLADFDINALQPPSTEVLIVHDRNDKEVPYSEGAHLARSWSGAELVSTQGLGHQRILTDVAVVERVCGFVAAG